MKSKLILCFLLICLLVSSLGIASAFNLDTNIANDNNTPDDPSDDTIHRWTWRGKSFENPVYVNLANYVNIGGVVWNWQTATRDAVEDINNGSNETGSRANFAFTTEPQLNEEVTMSARSLPGKVDNQTGNLSNAPLAWADPYVYGENVGLVNMTRDEDGREIYEIRRAEVVINTDYQWGRGTSPDFHDLDSVIAHELGHVAGLGHYEGENVTMRSTIPVNTTRRWGTNADDVNGLIAIYGPRGEILEEIPSEEIISDRLTDIREESTVVKTNTISETINKFKNWWANLW